MRTMLHKLLYLFARAILRKYKPDVIGITGSVGKTSVKEALVLVLQHRFSIRSSEKNYNNEIGVPLTIIGMPSGKQSIFGWLGVFIKALQLLFIKDSRYPQILILEMGADKPGDIAYLTRLAPCTIGVLTPIGPAHLEKFGTIEAVIQEKQEIIWHLKGEDRWAVIPFDNSFPISLPSAPVRSISYGLNEHVDVFADTIKQQAIFLPGMEEYIRTVFTIHFRDTSEAMHVTALGVQAIWAILAAVAVGSIYQYSLSEIAELLRSYTQPKGRMNILNGIKKTLIIDDSYNSSPLACRSAIDALSSITIDEGARRIAVLGDMLELGISTEREHEAIGEYVARNRIDILYAVGLLAATIARGARSAGLDPNSIFCFDEALSAGKDLQDHIQKGDVILVKGSQGIRMERVVKEIMAEPEKARILLVRQEEEWT